MDESLYGTRGDLTELPTSPRGFVLVLKGGQRVPVDLRYVDRRPVVGHVWRPVIEGDLLKLMPMVEAVDAEYWPPATHVMFPTWPEKGLNLQWARQVMTNSPAITQVTTRGAVIRRAGN